MIELLDREITLKVTDNINILLEFSSSVYVDMTFIFDGYIKKSVGKIPLSKALETILEFKKDI